jgi:hypothetical protein
MSETVDPNTVTVSRADVELWQKSTLLLNKMLGDPVDAPLVEKIVEKHNPQAVFPGRAAREAIVTPLMSAVDQKASELQAKLDAESAARGALEQKWNDREAAEAEQRAKAEETALQTRIESIQAKRGFSDETMKRVLDRMREQNNPDVDAAAAWVAETIPKPLPASGHDFLPSTVDVYGSSASDPKETAWKNLHENPTQWQTNELRSIVKDPEFLRLGAA